MRRRNSMFAVVAILMSAVAVQGLARQLVATGGNGLFYCFAAQ